MFKAFSMVSKNVLNVVGYAPKLRALPAAPHPGLLTYVRLYANVLHPMNYTRSSSKSQLKRLEKEVIL